MILNVSERRLIWLKTAPGSSARPVANHIDDADEENSTALEAMEADELNKGFAMYKRSLMSNGSFSDMLNSQPSHYILVVRYQPSHGTVQAHCRASMAALVMQPFNALLTRSDVTSSSLLASYNRKKIYITQWV